MPGWEYNDGAGIQASNPIAGANAARVGNGFSSIHHFMQPGCALGGIAKP
jgi:hypothetical protein